MLGILGADNGARVFRRTFSPGGCSAGQRSGRHDDEGSLAVGRPLGNRHRNVTGRLVGKHKRYLIHVAGHNLGLLMRHDRRRDPPKEAIARGKEVGLLVPLANGSVLLLLAAIAGN